MIRRIGEPVAVRTSTGGERGSGTDDMGDPADMGDPGDPATFLWRGRVYVVREVLGHWRERRSWWTSPPARAVHGGGGGAEAGLAATLTAPGTRMTLDHECDVWRVEASAGRTFGTGVYDLCRDPLDQPPAAVPGPPDEDAWQLLRITD